MERVSASCAMLKKRNRSLCWLINSSKAASLAVSLSGMEGKVIGIGVSLAKIQNRAGPAASFERGRTGGWLYCSTETVCAHPVFSAGGALFGGKHGRGFALAEQHPDIIPAQSVHLFERPLENAGCPDLEGGFRVDGDFVPPRAHLFIQCRKACGIAVKRVRMQPYWVAWWVSLPATTGIPSWWPKP